MNNKIRLREVLNLVAALKRENSNLEQAEAFRLAWAALKLQRALKQGICQFQFKKVDGTIRTAYGTLNPAFLPHCENETETTTACVNQKYFDTEKNAWRCFKKVNLCY